MLSTASIKDGSRGRDEVDYCLDKTDKTRCLRNKTFDDSIITDTKYIFKHFSETSWMLASSKSKRYYDVFISYYSVLIISSLPLCVS